MFKPENCYPQKIYNLEARNPWRKSMLESATKTFLSRVRKYREVKGMGYPDGSSETRTGGSRAWRNNNAGNIRAGSFANRHGAVGEAGGFAVFPDEATGDAASEALLRTSTYSGLTVDEAIARRSPSNENDTTHLQGMIQDISGLSGEEIVGKLNKEEMGRLVNAIKRTEGWIEGETSMTPAR